MEDILSILYKAVSEMPRTERTTAAIWEADPMHEKLRHLTSDEEADKIWFAAMDVGTAESEDCFRRGFLMGFQLREELESCT